MSGPMGGNAGWTRTGGKSQRRMMTRGMRVGSYVQITYKQRKRVGHVGPGEEADDTGTYVGTIVDKRIGGQDRESYVELKDWVKLEKALTYATERGKSKKLIDAFIEECKVVDKQEVPDMPTAPIADGSAPVMMGGMGQMGGMVPMMMTPMGMMPMSMMPMGMNMMQMGMMGQMGMGMCGAMPVPGAPTMTVGGGASSVASGSIGSGRGDAQAASANIAPGSLPPDFRCIPQGNMMLAMQGGAIGGVGGMPGAIGGVGGMPLPSSRRDRSRSRGRS